MAGLASPADVHMVPKDSLAAGQQNGSSTQSISGAKPQKSMAMSFSSSLGSLAWLNRLVPTSTSASSAGSAKPKQAPSSQPKRKRPEVSETMVHPDENTDWSAPSDTKPPFAYNFLIFQAIKSIKKPKVTLGEIYDAIMERYGYYRIRKDETGWKNSIRHNLTVHECFVKVNRDKMKGENGKGGFWRIDEELAKRDVDFGTRGANRGEKKSTLKKRKKETAASTGEDKAVPRVLVEENLKPSVSLDWGAQSPSSGSTISADTASGLLSGADLKGPAMDKAEAEILSLLDDAYNEDDVLSSLKLEIEDGMDDPSKSLQVPNHTLGSSFNNVYNGIAGGLGGSFANLAGSFNGLADSISGYFKW